MKQDEEDTKMAPKPHTHHRGELEKEYTKPRVSKGKALGVPGVSREWAKGLTTVMQIKQGFCFPTVPL